MGGDLSTSTTPVGYRAAFDTPPEKLLQRPPTKFSPRKRGKKCFQKTTLPL